MNPDYCCPSSTFAPRPSGFGISDRRRSWHLLIGCEIQTSLSGRSSAAHPGPEKMQIWGKEILPQKAESPWRPYMRSNLQELLVQGFSLASKAYHAENIFSGRQRFSCLAAERPHSVHTYAGLLAKVLSSFESESGVKSQIFLVD